MQVMAGPIDLEVPANRTTQDIEVADKIQNLVPYEFIRISKGAVEQFFFIQNQGVIQRAAYSQIPCMKVLNVFQESEGPGLSDLFGEAFAIDCNGQLLHSDGGMIEFDPV